MTNRVLFIQGGGKDVHDQWDAKLVASLAAELGPSFEIDYPRFFFHGTADETAPIAHVELYKRAVRQARVRKLAGRDHQLNGDLSEVAAEILALA